MFYFHVFVGIQIKLSSQMLLNDIQCWCLLSEILDDDTRASANLAWFAFFIDFAQATPFAQFLAAVNFQQWNLMFVAEGSDELLILWLIATIRQDAENSLTPGLGGRKKLISVLDFCLILENEIHPSTKVSSDPFFTQNTLSLHYSLVQNFA